MDIICHPIIGDPDYWFQDGGRLSPFATADQRTLTSSGAIELPPSLDKSTAAHIDILSSSYPQPPRLQGRGMYLWSIGIAFDHPATGSRIDLSIEEPETYQQLRRDFLP